MTPQEILRTTGMYRKRLLSENIPKTRIHPRRAFGALSKREALAFAHYLCEEVKNTAYKPEKWDQANRDFSTIQCMLGFAGWYTYNDLLQHTGLRSVETPK